MDCHGICICMCVCVRDCYAFHSVYVMPPVKLACARGSGDQSDSRSKEEHLLDNDPPTRSLVCPATLRTLLNLEYLGSEKYLVIFLVCYNKYLWL